MKRASAFMLDTVSYRGGYVWYYTADFSRRWGELEASPTMIWLQPPGTATVGHVFLDAYQVTGDAYFYKAALRSAKALISAQHTSGGWNYTEDFAGKASLKKWYATIGKNAWRLEEFQRYHGNATFDDGGTAEAATLLLRLYQVKPNPDVYSALQRVIGFILKSQYPSGGWPQRFPLVEDTSDYSRDITFNDDVITGNIDFLMLCYQVFRKEKFKQALHKAMNIYLLTWQREPQAGWALQYTPELVPAAARSYEPAALSPHVTARNLLQLIRFYRLTGDKKFLAPIPAALNWLEKVKQPGDGSIYPTFVEIGTNKPLYTHRRGSNRVNGAYFIDHNPQNTLAHYHSLRFVDVAQVRRAYEDALQLTPRALRQQSPLLNPSQRQVLPRLVSQDYPALFALNPAGQEPLDGPGTKQLLAELNTQGYWPVALPIDSNPYRGEPQGVDAQPADTLAFSGTMVGDAWDTSPYPAKKSQPGISTGVFVANMARLINYLDRHPD